MPLVFHNAAIAALHRPERYSAAELDRIEVALDAHGVLGMRALPTGVYPASSAAALGSSGYHRAWTRDNVYVALAKLHGGDAAAAAAVGRALLTFYQRYRHRFDIETTRSATPATRPHVRFDGARLEELPDERWPHAQNDALGYCLWLCARLARTGTLALGAEHAATLADMVRYFGKIRFWEDEDSGHWEEARRRSASSIGVVVAGLHEWAAWLEQRPSGQVAGSEASADHARGLARQGLLALDEILPSECIQPAPAQRRRYDAALLFLVYPLEVVERTMAQQIVDDVRVHLEGAVGIRRYPGDSSWAPDYDTRLPQREWTRDFSDDMATRDRLLERPGDEAQWCIFDPLVSALHGHRHATSGSADDRTRQVHHFNRALAQITADWRCPELYYWKGGSLVPNPHTPLLWTQAALQLALSALRTTIAAGGD